MDERRCPACGAPWTGGRTCEDDFHQMLYWEAERPALGVVHHLMVLCYHLQHPHLYSGDGLAHGVDLLRGFVERGETPASTRARVRGRVRSDRRAWTVTARPGDAGAYRAPVAWTVRACDVVAGGADNYVENVTRWAAATLRDLRASGNV